MRKSEQRYLIDVIRCLRLLARQGIALQENANEDNFSQFMLLLGTKDNNITKNLASKKHQYIHHEIQNELLDLMDRRVLLSKVRTIDPVGNRYCSDIVFLLDLHHDIDQLRIKTEVISLYDIFFQYHNDVIAIT